MLDFLILTIKEKLYCIKDKNYVLFESSDKINKIDETVFFSYSFKPSKKLTKLKFDKNQTN